MKNHPQPTQLNTAAHAAAACLRSLPLGPVPHARCLPTCARPPPLAADITGLSWSKVSRGSMLSVKRGEGPALTFLGFRDKASQRLGDCSAGGVAALQPVLRRHLQA